MQSSATTTPYIPPLCSVYKGQAALHDLSFLIFIELQLKHLPTRRLSDTASDSLRPSGQQQLFEHLPSLPTSVHPRRQSYFLEYAVADTQPALPSFKNNQQSTRKVRREAPFKICTVANTSTATSYYRHQVSSPRRYLDRYICPNQV